MVRNTTASGAIEAVDSNRNQVKLGTGGVKGTAAAKVTVNAGVVQAAHF